MKNMRSNFTNSFVLALAVLLSVAFVSCGFRSCCDHKKVDFEKRAEKFVEKVTKELDLKKEQQDRLQAIKAEAIGKNKANREIKTKIKAEIAALIKGDSIDKEELSELLLKKKTAGDKAREEMRSFLMDKFIEFHKLLSPEQRTKLALFIEKYHGKYSEYHKWK
jgi:Spy/CpxP family protein refolding chaperone